MPLEIERKYLIISNEYRKNSTFTEITQAYLSISDKMAIRIRINGLQASLAIKSKVSERINREYEYPRIQKYRGAKKFKGEYFGPFVSPSVADYTSLSLQKAFY